MPRKKSYSRKKSSTPGSRSKARKPSRKKTVKKGPSKAQVRKFIQVKYQTEEE